jgi:hypothetical protein
MPRGRSVYSVAHPCLQPGGDYSEDMIPALTLPLSYSVYQPPAIEETGTEDAVLPSIAVSLSAQSSVVASLGGNNGTAQIYTASGLLNAILQAGSLPDPVVVPPLGSPVQGLAQQQQNQLIAAGLEAGAFNTGLNASLYTGAGLLQNAPSSILSSYWGDVLKTRPNLAGVAANAILNGAVLGAFEAYA